MRGRREDPQGPVLHAQHAHGGGVHRPRSIISAAVASALVIIVLIFRLTIALPIFIALAGSIAVFEIFRAVGSQVNIPFFISSFVFSIVTPFAARGIIPVAFSSMVYIYFALFAASLVLKFNPEILPKIFITFVMVCSVDLTSSPPSSHLAMAVPPESPA